MINGCVVRQRKFTNVSEFSSPSHMCIRFDLNEWHALQITNLGPRVKSGDHHHLRTTIMSTERLLSFIFRWVTETFSVFLLHNVGEISDPDHDEDSDEA